MKICLYNWVRNGYYPEIVTNRGQETALLKLIANSYLYKDLLNLEQIKKGKKIYFYDCGIRNAIINNFNPIHSRTDAGALFENYFISERLKYLRYHGMEVDQYFWRTTQQQEIDLIEEEGGKMRAYEIKINDKSPIRFPSTFKDNYSNTDFFKVSQSTVEEFLIGNEGS